MKAVVILLLCAPSVAAQKTVQPCKLRVEDAPVIRGVKLGDSFEAIPSVFTRLGKAEEKPLGATELRVHLGGSRSKPQELAGLDGIRLTFLDGRLFQIWTDYDSSIKWSAESLAAQLSKAFNLPNRWKIMPSARYGLPWGDGRMNCGDVEFSIIVDLNSSVLLMTDAVTQKQYNARVKSSEDAKRDAFRP